MDNEYSRSELARENLVQLLSLREQCRDSVHVHVLVGLNQWLLGRNEEALASYRQALTIDHRPEIYLAIGDILLALDRFDEAVESYTTAVRFKPDAIHAIPSGEAARLVREKVSR
jgi:tetratricopeptide (TPR) repeat protein